MEIWFIKLFTLNSSDIQSNKNESIRFDNDCIVQQQYPQLYTDQSFYDLADIFF